MDKSLSEEYEGEEGMGSKREDGLRFVASTGITDLDYYSWGMRPGELIMLAARPAMGKTTFAVNVAKWNAVMFRRTVAYFSLELSKENIYELLISCESNVPRESIRTGQITKTQEKSIIDAEEVINNSKIRIFEDHLTTEEIMDKCKAVREKDGLNLVIIDYLQLIQDNSTFADLREENEKHLRELKEMAVELNVPVLVTAQLERGVDIRADHHPRLSDIADSRMSEQYLDQVWFLYRDYYYQNRDKQEDVAEIIVAKGKYDAGETVKVLFEPEIAHFKNKKVREEFDNGRKEK